ncbi:prolyl-tRNA synthetase [Verrucomicrobium sp. GAS474]|uniref:proline--tRNA ligase n=1 Tax=Verrucomicrobium sp. GAS474 TaxID=1882831 RepID=UPI00087D7AEC|nr:proline--tRNA ligase [Verrucomicrobium sp. GAS474]SDU26907.1 prolyl-tRNA synthetase [Verrucomicrobium sp. GAS474]
MSQQPKPQQQQNAKPATAITPTRQADFPEWYQQVIAAADMAENSEVRGCMVIKPWGYGIWELIQAQLDVRIKATGHKNAYFPMFIPLSYLEKEAKHVEGFAKECAVVTHHRLEAGPDGKLVPTGKLAEPLVVRPTSETIIGAAYSRWVQSYRDLPILINQWANVVRWELRPRLFLRTAEFLWQEGHTAHETAEEAVIETEKMLREYEAFAKEHLALPVLTGEKSENERFPGALRTLCIEAMVQDRKAVQAGTSHFLGQNFAKAYEIKFLGREKKLEHAWTTSWGVSTRLIGTMIMAHSDDDGLVLPPRVAPTQIVIIPVIPKDDQKDAVLDACYKLAAELRAQTYAGEPVRVEVDNRDTGGSSKGWEWIKKGVPLRAEIGPRDLAAGTAFVGRRDKGVKEKSGIPLADLVAHIGTTLTEIQAALYARAEANLREHTRKIDTKEEFYAFFTPQNPDKPEIHGGFALTHFAGDTALEEKLKEDLKVTIRCIPFEENPEGGTCPFTGQPSKQRVVFAKSY